VSDQPVFVPPFRQLVEGVQAYFLEHGVTTVVERGWKNRDEQVNQGPGRANRVIFAGSKPDGSAGTIVNPRQVGWREVGEDPENPDYAIRALSDWSRALYVSIWAFDGDHPNDEGAQDDAVYALFTWVQRAVQSVAFGNAVWGKASFTVPAERGFGLELLVELTFQHMIPDLPTEITRPSPVISKGLP
jgi:hypothetical protein